MHAGGRGAAQAPSCPKISAASPSLFKNSGDDIRAWLRGGRSDANDLLEPPVACSTNDPSPFQSRKAPLVGTGVARAHRRLETRHRQIAIRDQDRFAVSHSIEQSAQSVFRLGYRGCLHEAIIAFSETRDGAQPETKAAYGLILASSALMNASVSPTGIG